MNKLYFLVICKPMAADLVCASLISDAAFVSSCIVSLFVGATDLREVLSTAVGKLVVYGLPLLVDRGWFIWMACSCIDGECR